MVTSRAPDALKRLIDVTVASAALVILAPLILGLALLLRITQRAPVLFRQTRPGLGGAPFTMYKFRTMTVDAPTDEDEATTDAQRTTRLGRLLRSLSLDELPELWNVIKGDMSLVGPRPLLMEYLPRFTPEQARRHEVRPGITGLAQVSGRNALTWEQKFALDVKYVDEHDLRMDLDIIFRTIGTLLSREGISHSEQVDMPKFLGTEKPDGMAGQNR
jgi:lipopolysaccharide/colanic/teichoic acid biosynthesis glycosyltransferase